VSEIPPIKISPSLLSADAGCFAEEVRAIEAAGADMLHLDVMDGHFVPNLTIGPFIVDAINRAATRPLDVHLMLEHPGDFVEAFAKAGADIISFQVESKDDPAAVIEKLRSLSVKPSIVINPDTPASAIEPYAGDVEMVLVMSVYPGFPGQKFIADVVPKVKEVRELIGPEKDLEVDGGITLDNVHEPCGAGANVIVAGTAIFKADDMAQAISGLRNAAVGK